VLLGVTVPTKPEAKSPVRAGLLLTPTVPTAPDAALPVKATATVTPESEANGVSAKAEIPNMV
jgi:hypothetical protein